MCMRVLSDLLKRFTGVLGKVIIVDRMIEYSCQLIVDRSEISRRISLTVIISLGQEFILPL